MSIVSLLFRVYQNFVRLSFLVLVILLPACTSIYKVLPETSLIIKDKYHCWPYNVSVYSVGQVTIDSTFFTYPIREVSDDRYEHSTWVKYEDSDSHNWSGMDKTLKECDGNKVLYNQIESGKDIYFAGTYSHLKNWEGKKMRNYDMIYCLAIEKMELHIFKDMNKM